MSDYRVRAGWRYGPGCFCRRGCGQLGQAGQLEAALESAREAVAIHRELAEANPDAYLYALAASLGNLGVWQNIGRTGPLPHPSPSSIWVRRTAARW